MDIFEKVRATLAKQLRIEEDKVKPESKIKDDLGADSLDVLQLLMTIEEEYDITIPDERLANFEKVSDIVDFLKTLK